MSFNKYRKRKLDGDSDFIKNDISFEIGKNKRVTIRKFRSINLIDIREYYQDQVSGELKPGKKGISLTEEQYDEFINSSSQIEDALRQLGSKRDTSKTISCGNKEIDTSRVEISNKRLKGDQKLMKIDKSNPRLDDHMNTSVTNNKNDDELDSSDEDFAQVLESAVRTKEEYESEEE